MGVGRAFLDAQHHQVERVAHLLGVGQVDAHAAEIGFVNDVRRRNFQHHRITEALGNLHRFIAGPGNLAAEHVEIVGAQNFLRLDFADLRLAAAHLHVDDAVHAAAVDREAGDDAGRPAPPRRVIAHRPQRGDGAVGRRIIRDAHRHQFFLGGGHFRAAHEHGQHRFLALVRRAELFRQFQRTRHVLRRHDHHNRVNLFVVLHHLERLGVTIGFRVANDVHGIAERRGSRQERRGVWRRFPCSEKPFSNPDPRRHPPP